MFYSVLDQMISRDGLLPQPSWYSVITGICCVCVLWLDRSDWELIFTISIKTAKDFDKQTFYHSLIGSFELHDRE